MKNNSKIQIKLLSFLIALLIILISTGNTAYANNRSTFPSPKGTGFNVNSIQANTLIAAGARGSLPDNFAGVTAIDRQILIGTSPEVEVVLYELSSPSATSREDNAALLRSLPYTQCVTSNTIFSSGNTWLVVNNFGMDELTVSLNTEAQFHNQWAFDAINLPAQGNEAAGRNTTIAIIDGFPSDTNFIWHDKEVIKYQNVNDLMPIPVNPNGPDLREHGNFIVSLTNKIVPRANILAIDTFNDNGLAHTYNIITAINQLLTEYKDNPDGNRLLVNMSFNTLEFEECDLIDHLFEYGTNELEAVFVASAGNDSTPLSTSPAPMSYPASSPHVVSVAASDRYGQIADYSSTGDFIAPGGDSMLRARTCNRTETAIIGRVPTRTVLGVTYKNMASCGTSFSAPLVTASIAYVASRHTVTSAHAVVLLGPQTLDGSLLHKLDVSQAFIPQ